MPLSAPCAPRHLLLLMGLFTGLASAQLPLPNPAASGCDPLDPAHCMLPFPSSFYLRADPTSRTGLRVNIPSTATPANLVDVPGVGLELGQRIQTGEWNRQEGFSLGAHLITYVPGLDLHQTWGTADQPFAGSPNSADYFDHRDHIADINRYRASNAPIVLLNARTGRRHPFWSELDTHADTTAANRTLLLRPAVNLDPGTQYIVALRRLRDADGALIEAGPAFAALREGNSEDSARQAHYETLFATLRSAGIRRDELYLAWDFVTTTTEDLTERMLHIRDEAFALLGDTDLADGIVQGVAPQFRIISNAVTDEGEFGRFRRVEGAMTVPNFTTQPQDLLDIFDNPIGANATIPGTRLYYAADGPDPDTGDGLPDINPIYPTTTFRFTCDVPLDQGPSYPMTYGHGLVGSRSQIGDAQWPRRYGFLPCGVDWWGMSREDLSNIALILADVSNFPSLADRSQQGFLNFLYLARAATHPQGLATHPCFQANEDCATPGDSLIRTATATSTPVFYDGNSQGGILGPGMIAVSPDIDRGILGVPGINYSTLLNRSVDWEGAYGIPNYVAYREPIERQLLFHLIQMLWDRGEGNGYAHRLTTDPLPNTPPHEVMLQVAYSDHQVSNHAAEVFARTIGAPIMLPGLPAGRHWEAQPYYTPTARYPHRGSALIYWDSGNARPPNGNVPADAGSDPHSHARREVGGGWQEAHFLLSGEMVDICQGGDYLTVEHPEANGGTPCPPPARAPGPYRPVQATAAAPAPDTAGGTAGGAMGGLWLGLTALLLAPRRRRQH